MPLIPHNHPPSPRPQSLAFPPLGTQCFCKSRSLQNFLNLLCPLSQPQKSPVRCRFSIKTSLISLYFRPAVWISSSGPLSPAAASPPSSRSGPRIWEHLQSEPGGSVGEEDGCAPPASPRLQAAVRDGPHPPLSSSLTQGSFLGQSVLWKGRNSLFPHWTCGGGRGGPLSGL